MTETLIRTQLGDILVMTYVVVASSGIAFFWAYLDAVCTDICWTIFLNALNPGWGDDLFDTEFARDNYGDCEAWNTRAEGKFIRAPANSWSNISFIILGNYLIALGLHAYFDDHSADLLSNQMRK